MILSFLLANKEDDESDSDAYTFEYEDKALENYKAVHPCENGGNSQPVGLRFEDQETGAHFDFLDLCKRL